MSIIKSLNEKEKKIRLNNIDIESQNYECHYHSLAV